MTFSGGWIREVKPATFIYEVARALPADVCLEAIRRFEACAEQQYPGRIGQAGREAPEVKRSTDLRISGREDWRDIDRTLSQQLVATFNEFAREFPFFAANSFKDIGYNLQRTLPGRVLPLARGRRPRGVQRAPAGRDLVPERRPGPRRRDRVSAAGESRSGRRRASWSCSRRSGPTCIAASRWRRASSTSPRHGSVSHEPASAGCSLPIPARA